MTDPSSRLGEIKERSERGSAWWLDPISDARWLLEHVEQQERRLRDKIADEIAAEQGTAIKSAHYALILAEDIARGNRTIATLGADDDH